MYNTKFIITSIGPGQDSLKRQLRLGRTVWTHQSQDKRRNTRSRQVPWNVRQGRVLYTPSMGSSATNQSGYYRIQGRYDELFYLLFCVLVYSLNTGADPENFKPGGRNSINYQAKPGGGGANLFLHIHVRANRGACAGCAPSKSVPVTKHKHYTI